MKAHHRSFSFITRLPQLAQTAALVVALLCPAVLAEQPTPQLPNEVQLKAEPNRCITLHQGQVCYQQVTFSWQTPNDGQFCLHSELSQTALTCWQGATQTGYNYTFEASESTYFEIRPKGEDQVLGRIKVQVAAVYKTSTRSHSRWRLF